MRRIDELHLEHPHESSIALGHAEPGGPNGWALACLQDDGTHGPRAPLPMSEDEPEKSCPPDLRVPAARADDRKSVEWQYSRSCQELRNTTRSNIASIVGTIGTTFSGLTDYSRKAFGLLEITLGNLWCNDFRGTGHGV